MLNSDISSIFRDITSILQIKGENPFRIRAYERAAQNIEGLSEDLSGFLKRDALSEIPGIGNDLADKIKEYAATGKIKMYERLKRSVPAGLLDLLDVPSVGPKTAKLLYEKLKIKNIPQLEAAIKKNKLRSIFGIKEKTAANILKGIEILKRGRERLPLAQADLIAQEFLEALKRLPEVKKISVAGSLRRQKETVRDIDILVVSNQPQKLMRSFISLPQVKDVQARGETKSSVRTAEGIQVDCRV
ncbi:MAG: DNA polymerase III, partial [Candidatus Omnitrophica bacterium]|nr:DNA polymerase III [Candidatus Omnitrophota bacterium]